MPGGSSVGGNQAGVFAVVAISGGTNSTKTPWAKAEDKKSQLLKRLLEAEQQQDFYSDLYRQYTSNLLKLVIYVRSLLANPTAREYLQEHHAEVVALFEQVLEGTES